MPGHVQVHLALEPVSLLKSIDGLCAEVERRFGDDPMHGHVFVFLNRARTGAKLLYWDHGGFVVVYKRLERGRFQLPPVHGTRVRMTAAQLGALLDGIDLSRARRVPLWEPREPRSSG
jgi:transposase